MKIITKEEALSAIKALRDKINAVEDGDGAPWVNNVCHHLDQAADVIEFPSTDGRHYQRENNP